MSNLAVRLEGVGKDYRFFSLNDVHLEVPEGHIAGFIGPNGAGKSTTIRILMGLVHQDRGEVQVLGHQMPAEQAKAKWDVGFASDDMRLCVKAMLLLVLSRRPRLLLLDEPTTGLDPVARHEVLRELTDVLADERRSILFSSHNTQDVEQISDQITFIDRGRIIDSRDKETFLDRWRRLRVEVPAGIKLPAISGVVDIRQDGRLAVATTNAYDPGLPNAYESAGAHVQSVEHMTLEEIFVATVQQSREGAEA